MASPRQPDAYPAQWEADVVLRDGSTAHVRPIRPADAEAIQRMHHSQSERSIYLRYFTYKSDLTAHELQRFTHVDHQDRVALVIVRSDEIIAVGRFDRLEDRGEAEVAFNVRDAEHGKGLGSILLEHLAAAGREVGIQRFTAEVLPENRRMLTVFTEAGFDVARHFENGVVMVSFEIDPTERSVAVMESREHRAEARSLAELLRPRSVAVVGASHTAGGLGRVIHAHLVEAGFDGPVYAVNPVAVHEGRRSQGIEFHARVTDLPSPVDLAVVAVPQDQLLRVARECAQVGVKGIVVVTAGFRTAAALSIQRDLVRVARANGMRVIGPASLGVSNTAADVRLNASTLMGQDGQGQVGLFSQSSALGSMLHAVTRRHGLRVSASVNAGNRADVSGNDLMQYFEDDDATDVVAMYLESFGNPRKFSRIARRLSSTKPVIVAKPDRMGLRLPPGHEVRTTQAPPGAVDAMLRQSGVVQVRSQEELCDIAQLLVAQPLPAGPRVGIVSNSDALAAVAAEHARSRALSVASVSDDVDVTGADAAATLRAAVSAVASRDDVDAVVVTVMPATGVEAAPLVRALQTVEGPATLLACFAGFEQADVPVSGLAGPLPCYANISATLDALRHAVTYRQWRDRDQGEVTDPEGIDPVAARRLVSELLTDVSGTHLRTLDQDETARLLSCYGITLQRSVGFATEDEAARAAEQLGYPVALKARDAVLRHRLDLGGVRLNVTDEEALRRDVRTMRQVLAPYGELALEVQAMMPTGQGCVVRAVEDPLMGPLVSFGLGGDAVTLLDDWAHAVPPLTPGVLHDLVRAPRASPKLFGHQGLPVLDTVALLDLVHRIGQLKDDLPQVALLEINPVLVATKGVYVLSAEVRVGNPVQRTDSARRAMSLPSR